MKFKAITLKDIAQALNLSTSTVSRALRDSYEISEDTRKRVIEYAKTHNYRPNPSALGLRERRTKSIGVMASAIANTFFSEAMNGIDSIAFKRGYNVIITQTHESYKQEVANLDYLSSRSIDGLLISLSAETRDVQHLKAVHEKGLPIVCFDRIAEDINTHKIMANNFKGAYDATKHLIDSGFTKIAHLANVDHLSITKERLKGFEKAMDDHHLPIPPHFIQHCPHGGSIETEIKEALDAFFSTDEKPEAIFTAGGKLTTGCLRLLKARGIRVPEDIAIVGFSNSELFDLFNPPITIVRQPAFEMGQIATEKLLEIIESKYPVTEFERIILPTTMTIRDSSVHQL